jgi:hypothetical protein
LVILLDLKGFFAFSFPKENIYNNFKIFYSDWTVRVVPITYFSLFICLIFFIICASFFLHFGLVCNKEPEILGCEKPLFVIYKPVKFNTIRNCKLENIYLWYFSTLAYKTQIQISIQNKSQCYLYLFNVNFIIFYWSKQCFFLYWSSYKVASIFS